MLPKVKVCEIKWKAISDQSKFDLELVGCIRGDERGIDPKIDFGFRIVLSVAQSMFIQWVRSLKMLQILSRERFISYFIYSKKLIRIMYF